MNNSDTNNNNNNVFKYYIRSIYIIFIAIIISMIYNKTDYIFLIYNYIKSLNSYTLIINIIALYFILYKLKFEITFSISYN